MKAWACALLLLPILIPFVPGTATAELSREPGAIYLDDFMTPGDVIFLRVIRPAPVYYQLDGKRRLGTLKVGYDAEIVAISQKAYMVRAKAEHADVKGWISPQALQAHNGADFVATLEELYQRQLQVNQLIAARRVALGMTLREVKLSLGEPDRVSSTLNAGGSSHTLDFICYEKVPQIVTRLDQYGVPYRDTVWFKVETGKTEVSISNDVVTSISHTEGAPNLASPVTIAPPPLLVF